MPSNSTARHALPLLSTAQALKEITHNEALVRVDALLHPVVVGQQPAPPSSLTDADDGRCWIVAASATGSWAGNEQKIARWTGGSWRFLDPADHMQVYSLAGSKQLVFNGTSWVGCAQIPNPNGGATIDAECRQALSSLLSHLRAIGVVPV